MEDIVHIIILNWNGKELLKDCLPSVVRTKYSNFKVVVVDNGSTDGSREYIRHYFPDVKLIENKKNLGFAEGNNVGIRYAMTQGADYIALLNNDTEVDPSWISEVVKVAESKPDIGACATKMLFFDARTVINSAGTCMTPFGGGWDRGLGEKDVGQYDTVEEVFGACAGAMLIKRDVIEEVGLFDSKHFIYYEDVDLTWRMRLFGYKIMYVPTAIVYHKLGATMGNPHNWWRRYLTEKNRIRNVLKNYSPKMLRQILPKMTYHDMKQVFFLLKGDSSQKKLAQVFIRAYLWNIWHVFNTFKLRMKIQKGRKLSDEEVMRWITLVYGNIPIIVSDYQIQDKSLFLKNNKSKELLQIVINNNDKAALGPGWTDIERIAHGEDFIFARHTTKNAYCYLCFPENLDVSEYKFSMFVAGGPKELNGCVTLNKTKIGDFTLKSWEFVSIEFPISEDIFNNDKNVVECCIQLSTIWVPNHYFHNGDNRHLGIKVHKLGMTKDKIRA